LVTLQLNPAKTRLISKFVDTVRFVARSIHSLANRNNG
jgi:hypothetical protein